MAERTDRRGDEGRGPLRPFVSLLLCACLLCLPLAAQPTTDSAAVPAPATVELPFERQPGERATVRVVKTAVEREGGLLVDSLSGVWRVDTRVLAARPRGYTLAWTYRAERDTSAARVVRFDLRTNTLSGVPIVFRTDRRGQPYEIANGDSLRAALGRALRRLAARLPPEQYPALDAAQATAASDAGLEAMLLADPERFYLVSGGRYPRGRAVTSRSALPNPFGSRPIPATTSFQLEPLSAADSVVTVRWRQTPDADALARVIVTLLREVAPGGPRLSPAEVARRFGVEERATYRIGRKRGRVLGVDYRKTVRFGERTRTDRVQMQTLPTAGSG